MYSNGEGFLQPVSALGSKGPQLFARIHNDDGTTSLWSKTHNRLVEAQTGHCNRSKFEVRPIKEIDGEGRTFKMLSCDSEQVFLPPRHVGGAKYEFESNWFYGYNFFVMHKHPDGSINILLRQHENGKYFSSAAISGKVVNDNFNRISTLERMLKVNNLYRDNLGRYHLQIAGRRKEFHFDAFIESTITNARKGGNDGSGNDGPTLVCFCHLSRACEIRKRALRSAKSTASSQFRTRNHWWSCFLNSSQLNQLVVRTAI